MASNADLSNISIKWKEQLEGLLVPDFSAGHHTREDLGSGLYGETSLITQNGTSFAAKKIHIGVFSKDEFRASFTGDCLLMSRLRHPHVAQFLGVQIGDSFTPPLLISELYPLSLNTCIQRYPEIPGHSKHSILLETAVGIEYLHQLSPPVIHAHLSPNNILLTEGLHVKIADCVRFGLNVSSPPNSPYQPPEETPIEAGDIFSLGDIMLHVVLQREPSPLEYKHHRNPDNKNEPVILTELKRRERFLEEVDSGHKLKDLILSCLEEDSTLRPTISNLIKELNAIVQEYEPEYKNILEMFMALGQLSLIKDSISSLEETVKAKEEEIEALKDQMEPLKAELDAKEDALTAQKKEMDGYKQAMQSKDGRIRAHETGVRAKEALIKAKDREIAAKKQVITTKEALLKSANKRIGVLEQHVKSSRKKGSNPVTMLQLGGGDYSQHGSQQSSSIQHNDSKSDRSQQSSPDNVTGLGFKQDGGGTRSAVYPYRSTTSPLHADGFKFQRSSSLSLRGPPSQSDPKLAQILARQQQKINDNLDCIHEKTAGDDVSRESRSQNLPPPPPPLRKRSNTFDSSGSELRKILQKRKSFVEDDV